MSHRQQRAFFARVRRRFPEAFHRVRAVDCGSLDVNGCLKPLFTESEYVGVDIRPGNNVDVVAAIHEAPLEDGTFDTVVSAEMLEHDEFWQESLRRMYRLLRSGGLLAVSAGGIGREEHGTDRAPDGAAIYGTSATYYRNLSPDDLRTAFSPDFDTRFSTWQIRQHRRHHDLYFVGVTR